MLRSPLNHRSSCWHPPTSVMFSVVAEALTIALAAVPAILKVELASSNPALSPLLALCVIFSGALGVVLARHNSQCQQQAGTPAPQRRDDRRARQSPVRQEPFPASAAAPSLGRRPNGLREDLKRRDSEELLELSLGETPESRHDTLHATAAASAAAATAATAATAALNRSTKNGHGRHRVEAREDAAASSSKRNNNRASSAAAVPRPSRAAPAAPASALSSAAASAAPTASATKRQRYHHHYRKGGEILYIVEGVAQAAVGLLRDPVRGAQVDGAKGFAKGLGSGVLGVALKPVKGVAKAGVNAYTGVRIGASKAGRAIVGGGVGGSRGGSSKASQDEDASTETAPSNANGRRPPSFGAAAASRQGGSGAGTGEVEQYCSAGGWEERRSPKAARGGGAGSVRTCDVDVGGGQSATAVVQETPGGQYAERGNDRVAGAATMLGGGGAATGGDGRNGRRHPAASAGSGLGLSSSLPSPSFDGLAVAVSTVPLVLSSLFVLAELNRIGGGGGGGVEIEAAGFSSKGYGEDVEDSSGSVCADDADVAAYLEVMLEGSMLCAVWEVIFAVQRAARGRASRGSSTLSSRVLSSQLLRLAVLLVGCVWCCRLPLLPLWCAAVYDVVRRALHLHRGRQMRRLSLRPGEAAVLSQAIVLWAADACVYTVQELCVIEPGAWEGMFPRAPSRSGGMVVVQTGILGALVTGLAVSVARALAPAAWQSSTPRWRGYALTYTVFAGGTVAWLTRWTAPLLRVNPISWVLLYALGYSDPAAAAARAAQHILQAGATAEGDMGWGKAMVAYVSGAVGWVRSELDCVATARDGVALREGMSGSRPMLVVGWAAALVVGVPLVPRLSRRLSLSKTASRKLFHALATAMFLPAIALEREFLSLALGAALGVLLAVEFLRCAGCPPVAAALDRYYGEFLDARDGGCVVVTHLFLLLGCAVPVWLCGLTGSRHGDGVLPYGGVIVLGIGDATGAVVGSSLGRLHWPGSRRTLEGSASVFSSTLASLVLVSSALARRGGGGGESEGVGGWWLFGGPVGWGELATSLAWPVALVSLMEAFTTQVDNLILPCVLFSCLALAEA